MPKKKVYIDITYIKPCQKSCTKKIVAAPGKQAHQVKVNETNFKMNSKDKSNTDENLKEETQTDPEHNNLILSEIQKWQRTNYQPKLILTQIDAFFIINSYKENTTVVILPAGTYNSLYRISGMVYKWRKLQFKIVKLDNGLLRVVLLELVSQSGVSGCACCCVGGVLGLISRSGDPSCKNERKGTEVKLVHVSVRE